MEVHVLNQMVSYEVKVGAQSADEKYERDHRKPCKASAISPGQS